MELVICSKYTLNTAQNECGNRGKLLKGDNRGCCHTDANATREPYASDNQQEITLLDPEHRLFLLIDMATADGGAYRQVYPPHPPLS